MLNSVAFISEKLKKDYECLREGRFEDKKLYDFITRAISDLKLDHTSGTKIQKKLWPAFYKPYQITNLWKYDLPNGWRLIYTIEADDVRLVSILLEWFSHKDYEKRFGY